MISARSIKPLIGNTVKYSTRKFHKTIALSNGSIFRMPAMSPTMTEGGIVSWKYKTGENFSSGDVLLEVETDKATIDVEAQDDGVMWEILVEEGAKGVPVGKPIAFLAEEGDDLKTLEKPSLEEEKAPKEEPKEETKEESKEKVSASKSTPTQEPEKQSETPSSSQSSASSDIFSKANPKQKFLPSVEMLLHQNNISAEEALEKIPASGAKGRLMRWDVLSYLGKLSKDSIVKVSEYVNNKSKLDLSNIVLATPKEEIAKQDKDESPKPTNIINVKLTSQLGEEISKEKFQYAFEKSIQSAIRISYASRFPEYANSPSASSSVEKNLFDDLITPSVTKSRFEVSKVKYNFFSEASAPIPIDTFDELLGLSAPQSDSNRNIGTVNVEFDIKFDEKLLDAKDFVSSFEKSLLSQIPANELIISN